MRAAPKPRPSGTTMPVHSKQRVSISKDSVHSLVPFKPANTFARHKVPTASDRKRRSISETHSLFSFAYETTMSAYATDESAM
jgi:hypothetical protein